MSNHHDDTLQELLDREGADSETHPDAPLRSGTTVTRGHGRSKTLQVRLNADEYDQLVAAAKAHRVPVSTFARHLLLSALHADEVSPAAAIERIRHDLDVLAHQLAS